jgi:hypothetical protein
MIQEIGKQGRMGAIADGKKAIVTVKERPDGNYSYVFTRVSNYIRHFDLPALTKYLNEIDSCGNDSWGGGDLVMGSPRKNGSKLNPHMLEFFTNTIIQMGTDKRYLEKFAANDPLGLSLQNSLQISS